MSKNHLSRSAFVVKLLFCVRVIHRLKRTDTLIYAFHISFSIRIILCMSHNSVCFLYYSQTQFYLEYFKLWAFVKIFPQCKLISQRHPNPPPHTQKYSTANRDRPVKLFRLRLMCLKPVIIKSDEHFGVL